MQIAGLKILVVDDNRINVKLLGRTLTNNNLEVVSAFSGNEAIKLAKEEMPALILLDVLMPEMDGYETCKILKDSEETQHIPIIFLSAKNETIDKAKGLSLGAVDYLTKPFDPVEIIARIRNHLHIRREVIDLRQENEKIKSELQQVNGNSNGLSAKNNPFGFVDKLQNCNIRTSNKFFKINARLKFKEPPVTTQFIPVFLENNNLVYLIAGGFKKDYPTLMVQLLLEKYAVGLFNSMHEQKRTEQELYKAFLLILDAFSPDIYDVAFTLSLNFVHATKSELVTFAIHQSMPVILNNKMQQLKPESLPLYYDSEYAKIIRAEKFKLPSKAALLNYHSGQNLSSGTALSELFLTHFQQPGNGFEQSVEQVFQSLKESEEDQLITAIKLI